MRAELPNHGVVAIDPLRVLQGQAPGDDLAKTRAAIAILERHYPGWSWSVDHNSHQGVLVIKNLMLHNKWGMVVKLRGRQAPTQLDHDIMAAGGELLERFGCDRGPFTWATFLGRRTAAAVVVDHMRRTTNLAGTGLPILRQQLREKAAAAVAAAAAGQEAHHGGHRDGQ